MTRYRRYEILLPRRFNDGERVPPALLRQTVRELEARFGAVSAELQTIRGVWRSGGRISVFCLGSIRVPRVGLGVLAETLVDCSASHTLIRSHTGEGWSVHEEPGGTPGSARRRHALPIKN